ncbi:hypothetical protein [Paenibacillus sp. sptzw28]|uniref:beta-xylosidase family glycoside hydrolase n=1 Tax=Paenibacillus sp. sptzw28 TaxID=715179 RepID=UPI002163BBC1|nr:hypothetical protein [Paenibacillus sp. sptzw28]
MIDNNEGTVSAVMCSDRLTAPQKRNLSFTDDFSGSPLSCEWSFLRTLPGRRAEVAPEGHGLKLTGAAATLKDAAPSVFVCRRQQSLRMRVRTLLSFIPAREGEEAGIAIRLSDEAHLTLGRVRKRNRHIIVSTAVDYAIPRRLLKEQLPETGEIHLELVSDGRDYMMNYSLDGMEWRTAGRYPMSRMSPEVNWCFTGACVGMYATGNGNECVTPAYFRYFEYRDDDPLPSGCPDLQEGLTI